MDKGRLIGWLTAPLVVAIGLVLFGTVLGRGWSAPAAQDDADQQVEESFLATEAGALTATSPVSPLSFVSDSRVPASANTEAASNSAATRAERVPEAGERTVAGLSAFGPVGSLLTLSDSRLGGLDVPGATDYRDPVEHGAVPLMDVRGLGDVPVSEHFRVGDFAAKDGAQYARISSELVELMEDLRSHFGSEVHINSAYRHPALNFNERIDGAIESRHMAGLAADVWVEGRTPFEVASAVVDIRGCRVGLGLGAHYVHVDLREYAASWAYKDSEMAEADFDLWMLDQCEEFFGERTRLLIQQSACTTPLSGIEAVDVYRTEMSALAAHYRERRIRGAVLLDARKLAESDDPSGGMAFLPSGSPLLRLMRLDQMVDRAERNDNFVFVVVDLDGTHRTGIMRYDGTESGWTNIEEQVDAAGSDSSRSYDAASGRAGSTDCIETVSAP